MVGLEEDEGVLTYDTSLRRRQKGYKVASLYTFVLNRLGLFVTRKLREDSQRNTRKITNIREFTARLSNVREFTARLTYLRESTDLLTNLRESME